MPGTDLQFPGDIFQAINNIEEDTTGLSCVQFGRDWRRKRDIIF
jgi:hypothetical protein